MQVQHATCNMQHRHVETWTHGHADMLTRGHVACAEQVFVLASSECKSAFELGFRSLRRIFEVAYGQPFVFKSLCIDHTWAASNDAASMTAVSMHAGPTPAPVPAGHWACPGAHAACLPTWELSGITFDFVRSHTEFGTRGKLIVR